MQKNTLENLFLN